MGLCCEVHKGYFEEEEKLVLNASIIDIWYTKTIHTSFLTTK
jgi:hypothetical protein